MATSGTTNFSPEIAEFTDEAFERCGIDPSTLTARHLRSARRSLDLLFVEWANKGIHLWAVEQVTLDMVAGTATYNTGTDTVAILEMVLRRSGLDTPVFPMARDEYHYLPDKTIRGIPSNYYFNRAETTPTLSFWLTPENSTDDIIYYRMRRLQDAGAGSNTADVPYRAYEALTAGLAAKLAEKYAPDRENFLRNKAGARLREMEEEDRQRTPTRFRVRFGKGR